MSFRLYIKITVVVAMCVFCGNVFSAVFDPLFRVTQVAGEVFVNKPDGTVVKAQELYAYPYGSKVVVPAVEVKPSKGYVKPEVTISLSTSHRVKLMPDTEMVIGIASDTADSKTIDIKKGFVTPLFRMPQDDDVKAATIDALKIRTPLMECFGIEGKSDIKVSSANGLYSVIFALTDETSKIKGDQFELNGKGRNTVIEFFGDASFTRISCLRGGLGAQVERGVDSQEKATLKTGSQIKIWRVYSSSGETEAVSVMIVNPSGKTISYSYIEGESAVAGNVAAATADETKQPTSTEGTVVETSLTNGIEETSFGGSDDFGSFETEETEPDDSSDSSDWGDFFNNSDAIFDF